jgi:flagellar assembly protein FliH
VAEAIEKEKQDLALAREAFEAAAGELARLKDELVAETESHVLDLAVETAGRILHQEIQAGRYEIDAIVRDALRCAPAARDVVVRLHPADHAHLQATAGEPESAPQCAVRLVPDPGLGRAECVVETAEGTMDARHESQLEQAHKALARDET